MKTFVVLFILSISFSLGAQEKSERVAVKSGQIRYELTGSTKGTKTIWWDNYGDKSYEEIKSTSEIKMFGMVNKEEVHTVTIMIGDKFWSANLLDNTGQKGTMPYYDAAQEIAEEMSDAEAKQLEQQLMDALGGEKLGSETFLNRKCEVMKLLGAKAWVYKGMLLKTEAKIMGIEANEIATLFKENISVPASKFEPLSTINYEEVAQMQEGMFYTN
ncbi:MAG: hypothetical protein JEZ14_08550 [Marinilabiliaceae bacterium]|nr:hypothetical protein [Marinilabiliaceae bacterium]